MNHLSSNDEQSLLRFMHRAAVAIIASGWQAPALNVLDLYEDNAVNAERRKERPALAMLADDYAAPFACDCTEPYTYPSLRAALCALFGADEKGNVPFYFRTYAREESEYWAEGALDGTPLAGCPVFGLYMIREDDSTGYGRFLENVFCYREADDVPRNRYGQTPCEEFLDGKGAELERENGGEDGREGIYRAYSEDCAKLDADPRFSGRLDVAGELFDLDLSKVADDLGRYGAWNYASDAKESVLQALADYAAEGAYEYLNCNSWHPKVLFAA